MLFDDNAFLLKINYAATTTIYRCYCKFFVGKKKFPHDDCMLDQAMCRLKKKNERKNIIKDRFTL